MADGEFLSVEYVFAVVWVLCVEGAGEAGEAFLLECGWCAFEDAVVACADLVCLVACEVVVLWDF